MLGSYSENTIVAGDCLEVMAAMPDGCVGLVVTDPPFNVGKDYGNGFNDNKPLTDWKAFLLPRMEASKRVLWAGRLSFFWMPISYMWYWSKWFDEPYRVFAAIKDCVQYKPTEVQWYWDPVIFWRKEGKRTLTIRMGKRDWHMGKTSRWRTQNDAKWHPCPRPPDTVEYLITEFSEPGDLVFDPFMGSGTTAIAADRLGRRWFGCDTNPDYVEMALKRLEEDRKKRTQLPLEI